MPTQQTLLAFALVSAGIMVIPGPSNFFLLAHGIGHGRRSALAAMTGMETASAILGAVFWGIGAVWDLAFSCASGTIGSWLDRRPRIQAAQPRLEGLGYLALAGWAAVTGSHPAR